LSFESDRSLYCWYESRDRARKESRIRKSEFK
jgi:hypothetical protein